MRRIHRILSNALDDSDNNRCEDSVNMDSTVPSKMTMACTTNKSDACETHIYLTVPPKVAMACNIETYENDLNKTDNGKSITVSAMANTDLLCEYRKGNSSPLHPMSPNIFEICNIEPKENDFWITDIGKSIMNSPAIVSVEKYSDLESPVAPMYSPLTPLVATNVTAKKTCLLDERNKENSSPLRPMSPDTFVIYQTLTDYDKDFDTAMTVSEKPKEKLAENEPNSGMEHEDQISGFSSDTDSDFIPNSDEDMSEEDISARSRRLNVVVQVHSSEKRRKIINTPTSSNYSVIDVGDNISRTETSYEETTTDRAEVIGEDIIECYSNSENPFERRTTEGRSRKGRKRKYKEHTTAQRKDRKYANLPYHSGKKYIESKVFHDYTCNCLKRCHQQISKEKRQAEFQKYITLGSYEAQLLFIVNCVKETPKSRSYTVTQGNKTGKKRPREYKRTYKIGDIEVCRNMFINNFQISPKKVDLSLRKNRSDSLIKDRRGLSQGGWNKTQEEDVDFIKKVINSLPKYESHYRREQNSGCQYLKMGLTVKKIYDLYLEQLAQVYGESKKPVSFTTLKRIFYTNFNLRCKSLKKDTCNRCDTFSNKIKNCATSEEQEMLKKEKEKHLKRAEDLRKNMNKDLQQAKMDEHFECITFDLEKTLPLPRIPTSIVFYKRQLWLYNCGVHAGSDEIGHCYVWIEGEAGRGAQEVGSCLIHFIKNKLNPKVQHLALWSDCCGGQNRNIKIVLMLKVVLNSHPTLKTITLKYLESGHTFLPNDTDFSKIETQLKYHERIYTADEYINVIKISKKKNPLQVLRMKKEDFLSVKNIERKIVNRKVFVNKNKTNWLQTKEILLKKTDQYAVFMKTTLNKEGFQELNIEKKIKGKSLVISENDFTTLWPDGKEIPQAKLDDLKSMFDLIPKDCIDFYKTLRGNASIVDDVDGFGGQLDFQLENEDDLQKEAD